MAKMMLRVKKTPQLPTANPGKCIVLGNGPSLKKVLAEKSDYFIGKSLLAVNGFSVSEHFNRLKPVYYVMLDPGIWKSDHPNMVAMLDALEKTTWEMHLMIPHDARDNVRIAQFEMHRFIRIHYINYIVYKGFEGIGNYLFRHNLMMPQSQNVMVAALFQAINIGYKDIELFGADHNWHQELFVNNENIVCLAQKHFYDHEEKISYQPFYKMAHVKETFNMMETFATFSKVFSGYQRMGRYAAYRNAQITNMTEGSFVDAFPRRAL